MSKTQRPQRESYPVPEEVNAALGQLCADALQSPAGRATNSSIATLYQRLKLKGRYGVKVTATLIPLEDGSDAV